MTLTIFFHGDLSNSALSKKNQKRTGWIAYPLSYFIRLVLGMKPGASAGDRNGIEGANEQDDQDKGNNVSESSEMT